MRALSLVAVGTGAGLAAVAMVSAVVWLCVRTDVREGSAYTTMACLQHHLLFSDVLERVGVSASAEGWTRLSQGQYDAVVGELARRKLLDAGRGRLADGRTLLDPWGHAYIIHVRRASAGGQTGPVVTVRCLGADAQPDTEDDIVKGERPGNAPGL